MADPLTVFAIGDIDELGLRGVVLRGTDPEAIREAGRHLHKPVVVVPVEHWEQVVEALKRIRDTAMKHTLAARIPECGVFGGIAQDADWLLSELAAAMKASAK